MSAWSGSPSTAMPEPGQVSGQNPQGGSEWTSDTRHVRLIVGPRTDIPAAIAEMPEIACENAHDDLRRHR